MSIYALYALDAWRCPRKARGRSPWDRFTKCLQHSSSLLILILLLFLISFPPGTGLERIVLRNGADNVKTMTTSAFSSMSAAAPLIGWLVTASVSFVGYLLWDEMKELLRNRRMKQRRQRLGF
jgi:hypothetical protein